MLIRMDRYSTISRKRTQGALEKALTELGEKVGERSAKLRMLHNDLHREVQERQRIEAELEAAHRRLIESEKNLRLLSQRLFLFHEEQKQTIARELHDGVAQSLAAIKFGAEHALRSMNEQEHSETAKSAIERIIPLIQGTLAETRRIYTDLRPAILDDLGIVAAIDWLCRDFEKAFTRIHIEKELDVAPDEVPEPLKIVLFRVIQDILANIARHSGAQRATVSLIHAAGALILTIKDDGVGFNPEKAFADNAQGKGFGLMAMKERVELSDGFFSIESEPGRGTTIRAAWPVPDSMKEAG